MKAKEYVEMFIQGGKTDQCLLDIYKKMFDEMFELAESRKAKTDDALVSIVLETENKWKAFARYFPEINKDGFMNALSKHSPDFYYAITNYIKNKEILKNGLR